MLPRHSTHSTHPHGSTRPSSSKAAADKRPSQPQKPVTESFTSRQRRTHAYRTLMSHEQLVWHSMMRNESVPQTRRYFEAIVAGLDPQSDEKSGMGTFDNSPLSDAYTFSKNGEKTPKAAETSEEARRGKRKSGVDD